MEICNRKLIRITSSYFCAGIIVDGYDKVVNFAPILKWTKGRTVWWLKRYCKKKKWEMEIVKTN